MPATVSTSQWTTTGGIMGYTKFRWLGALTTSEASTALAKQKAFFDAVGAYIPTTITLHHQATMDLVDDQNMKTGIVTASTIQNATVGAAANTYNAAAGAWITWKTGTYVLGRPVTSRTFLVPLASVAFQNDGTIASTAIGAILAAANALIVGFPDKMIWYHHHTKDGEEAKGQTKVTAAVVPDVGGVLRSRRAGI